MVDKLKCPIHGQSLFYVYVIKEIPREAIMCCQMCEDESADKGKDAKIVSYDITIKKEVKSKC